MNVIYVAPNHWLGHLSVSYDHNFSMRSYNYNAHYLCCSKH